MSDALFSLNRDVLVFLGKLLGYFGVWYVIYELWVLPEGSLDAWLSVNIVAVTGGLLSAAGFDLFLDGRVLGLTGTSGVIIINGCNGLEAIGLFVGFVMAYPGDRLKRAFFLPMGILAIYLVNIARVAVLVLLQYYYPASFDFAHDYSTSAIFYLAIFGLWVIWINYGSRNQA
ncbi:MAG: exosortase X [Cyclonatronaceae bacterium]